MRSLLDDKIFTLAPSMNAAKNLSIIYKKKACKSIEHIATKVSGIVKKDQTPVINKLNDLEIFPVSTLFYVFNAGLVNALLHQKDVELVLRNLKQFSETPTEKFIGREVEIYNLNKYSWSREFAIETVKEAEEINGVGYAYMRPLTLDQLVINKRIIKHALALIKKSFGDTYYSEISHLVSDIIIFDGKGITGGSSSRVMGAIFIRIPAHIKNESVDDYTALLHLTPLVYYLEQIIHEVAHLCLDQLMAFDPLVLNKQDEKYDSPIRRDKRPMRGVFHATFVLARLVIFFNELNELQGEDEVSKVGRIRSLKGLLKVGVDTIKKYASLTPLGNQILTEIINVSGGNYA